MPIKRMWWQHDQDVHILRGNTGSDLRRDLHFQDINNNGYDAAAYLASRKPNTRLPGSQEADVKLTFTPLFTRANSADDRVYSGHGIHVDTKTGEVTVDGVLPTPQKNNFIIEVEAENLTDHKKFHETIRVHIHQSVTALTLTPKKLTIRMPPPGQPAKIYRFALRGLFDDGSMGDLTERHGVVWSSNPGGHVKLGGELVVAPGDVPGTSITITATLPAQLEGKSKTGDMHVAPPWGNDPAVPEAKPVSGGAATGPELAERPNIVFLADGFIAEEEKKFEDMAASIVDKLSTSRLLRPFDLLSKSINFWTVFIPAKERGISARCEVYRLSRGNEQVARPVPPPIKPPAMGGWNLSHLIYAVGLPVADDLGKSSGQILDEWDKLVGPEPRARAQHLVAQWRELSTRTFIEEFDNFPGMALGVPPTTKAVEIPLLALHPFRANRAGLDDFFAEVQAKDGTTIGGSKIGLLWVKPRADTFFKNTDLVVCLSSFVGGRPVNYGNYIAASLQDGIHNIPLAPPNDGIGYALKQEPTELDISQFCHTLAHELGHSFGLGDEYVEFDEVYPNATLGEWANVQLLQGAINGSLIAWRWHRIEKAAVVRAAITSTAGATFEIPVRANELQFAKDDVVLLRQRAPGKILRSAAVTKVSPALIVTQQSFSPPLVMVRTADGTRADLQSFGIGSLLFAPVVAPESVRNPEYQYALIVAKNIEDLISARRKELYEPPPGADVTQDWGPQHPDLSDLAPGLPGQPFCFKHKTSIVGLYRGGGRYARGIFHPSGHCMMRNSHEESAQFCPVCRYIMVDLIDPTMHSIIDRDYDDMYPLADRDDETHQFP